MGRPAGTPSGRTVALICSDLAAGTSPIPAGEMAASLRRNAPHVGVYVVEGLCANPPALVATLGRLGAVRVLVGCRAGGRQRGELQLALVRAGLNRGAIRIPELSPAEDADPAVVAEHTRIVLLAALARLAHSDTGVPIPRRLVAEGGVTRRSLFRTGGLTAEPVASVRAERCTSADGCAICTLACPPGALRRVGGRILVAHSACTGCGACLGVCPKEAISLGGETLEGFTAAARSVVAELARHERSSGVSLRCSRAASPVLGGEAVPFVVPSLEMVSAGWLLQLQAAGLATGLVSCDEETCRHRRDELAEVCEQLSPLVEHRWRAGRLPAAQLELREPQASRCALGADVPPAIVTPGRRVESPVAPLGEITVAAGRCSGCDLCARACPTGALTSRLAGPSRLVLAFDPAHCSTCGACVSACPERVLSLRPTVDSETLTGGSREIATVALAGRCNSCGRPLAAGIAEGLIGRRLETSHPLLAARFRSGRCADCLLGEAMVGSHASADVELSAVAEENAPDVVSELHRSRPARSRGWDRFGDHDRDRAAAYEAPSGRQHRAGSAHGDGQHGPARLGGGDEGAEVELAEPG